MTKFSDQLFDDLMREHGPALTHIRPPAQPKRHVAARRALVAGGGTLAVAAAIGGALEAGSASPAYAVTKNADGTTTVAVYRTSGIAGANARLRQLGDKQVVVVPIEPGCPRPAAPAVSGRGRRIGATIGISPGGSITVKAQGIPAGDIMVIGVDAKTVDGRHTGLGIAALTSPPAPSCIGAPPSPPGTGGSDS
jgi:hypothetical protein